MFSRVVCALLLSAPLASGVVQFASSSLYDIYDFHGEREVPLPKCANGCLIYASTTGKAEAYMKNLVVHDYNTGKDTSLDAISKQVQAGTSQKLPYDLPNKGRYTILNLNPQATPEQNAGDVAVYVVDRTKARTIDYEIYDAASMARATVVPKGVVTVMGATNFFVKADKGAANSYTARLAGFDSAQENNADGCVYAAKSATFDGFEFHVSGALVSIVFDKKNPVAIKANYNWQNVRHLDQAGWLSSPGFHGCAKVNAEQVFRQWQGGFYGEEFDLHSTNKVKVLWDIDSTLTDDIIVKDMTNSKRYVVKGAQKNYKITMDGTVFATSYYNSAAPPVGFIARHSATHSYTNIEEQQRVNQMAVPSRGTRFVASFFRPRTASFLLKKLQGLKKETPVIDSVKEFADVTTAHGAKQVLIARSQFSKIFWILLILLLSGVLVYVVCKLAEKYARHDRLTVISMKFDEVEFPAVTFCNLNPYKKSLMRLIPTVTETMDMFDKAASLSKESEKKINFRSQDQLEMREKRVKNLFRLPVSEGNEEGGNLDKPASNENNARKARYADTGPLQVYEAVEAHCRCIGRPDMECIRYDSPPYDEFSKCICTYKPYLGQAYPCYNSTIWYAHICPACSIIGTCDAEMVEGDMISRLIERTLGVDASDHARSPCVCRNRSSENEKPYCIRKAPAMRKLWELHVTPEPPAKMVVTHKPFFRPPLPSPESETSRAMGFSKMTDGVAMVTQAKQNLMFTMAALSLEQRQRSFQTLVAKKTHISDFKLHVDPVYGNCYTFNHDIARNLTSSRAGPMYGIRVLLYVNSSDYMTTSESIGVRVAVHPPSQYPFPDTFGYSAPVGFASSFGIKKRKIERLVGYADCAEPSNLENSTYDGYEYNPEGCHRRCFQERMIAKCDCGDPRFSVPSGKKHCSAFDAKARECLESRLASSGDFHQALLPKQECECKPACNEIGYSMSFSTSKWPSGSTNLGHCDGLSADDCKAFYRENAAMVEVYYEQLTYELMQESEAYGFVNLVADFGGHLGLWMGFSVITVVEVLTLLFRVVEACLRRRQERLGDQGLAELMTETTPKIVLYQAAK